MAPQLVPARIGLVASSDGLSRGGHVVLGVRALGLGRIVVLAHVALKTADRLENFAAVAADGKSTTFMDSGDVLPGMCVSVLWGPEWPWLCLPQRLGQARLVLAAIEGTFVSFVFRHAVSVCLVFVDVCGFGILWLSSG